MTFASILDIDNRIRDLPLTDGAGPAFRLTGILSPPICYNFKVIEALILGVVQGLTEFLPVSSTAHLILFPWFFKWTGEVDTLTFDIALHAGTLFALLLCFWRDWFDLILRKQKLLGMIVLASIPAGIAGLLMNNYAEQNLRSPLLI